MEAAIAADSHLLVGDEKQQIKNAIEALHEIRNGDEPLKIKQAIEALNKVSTDFAARRMDASIQSAMAGHKVDEFS